MRGTVVSSQRQSEIVQAALALLNEGGLEAVSLRAVANRLGVQHNTVFWHVGTKMKLRELMADQILADVSTTGLPTVWTARLRELARRYRTALLRYQDGAALVAGTYSTHEHTLRAGEAFVACLLDAGCDERTAAWTCWTIIYFTLGLAQEEQRAPANVGATLAAAVSPDAHPALTRTVGHLTDTDFDARFDFGLNLILNTLAATCE